MPSYEDMDASELEASTNACSDSVPECQKRLMGESMRGMVDAVTDAMTDATRDALAVAVVGMLSAPHASGQS